ncbi:hypothetical protein BK735P2_00021 [Bacteroides phage BK735P2]|nr:hypothetical protein BK735P2_00021 [Bacteroides phage BK735P2]
MEDFKERLVVERDELEDKIAKLEAFIGSARFENLDERNKKLLEIQCDAMRQYSVILNVRISILL